MALNGNAEIHEQARYPSEVIELGAQRLDEANNAFDALAHNPVVRAGLAEVLQNQVTDAGQVENSVLETTAPVIPINTAPRDLTVEELREYIRRVA